MLTRLVICLFCLGLMAIPNQSLAQQELPKTMFQGFLSTGVPDLDALYGVKLLRFINRTSYAGWTDALNLPTSTWYDNVAANYTNPSNYLVVDHESWPVDTQANRVATAQKFVSVYNELKLRRPDLQIGFYAYPVVRDFFNAILDPTSANYLAWQAKNNDFSAMWAVVDFVAPSIYFFYTRDQGPSVTTNIANAHTYFHANIQETIRLRTAYGHGQLIVPYVYYKRADGLAFLDQDVWQDMVNTAHHEADGMILWGGFGEVWNESALWWQYLKIQLRSPCLWGLRVR